MEVAPPGEAVSMQFDDTLVDVQVTGNTVFVSGEVDISTAPAVEEALLGCIRCGTRNPIVDLSDVTYFDSSGIQALLRAREAMNSEQGPIRLVGLNEHTERIFRMVGLERFFEIGFNSAA